jgi:hypothetical protein
VITLVYGLGFGLLLVLVLVPAVLAVQVDIRRQFSALRHGLRARAGLARLLILGAGAALTGLFTATLGMVIVTGALPAWLISTFPALTAMPALVAAMAVFLTGSMAVLLVCYVAGWLLLRPATSIPKPMG